MHTSVHALLGMRYINLNTQKLVAILFHSGLHFLLTQLVSQGKDGTKLYLWESIYWSRPFSDARNSFLNYNKASLFSLYLFCFFNFICVMVSNWVMITQTDRQIDFNF